MSGRSVETFVLIDDDAQFLLVMSGMLEDLGKVVHCARGGDEGIQIARDVEPDVAVVDLRMPGMDGIAVIKEIKRCLPDTFAILHANVAMEEDLLLAGRAGADAYIAKGVSPDVLIARAESAPLHEPPLLRSGRLNDLKREDVQRALDDAGGNKTEAAARLGISRRGLQKMLKRWQGGGE